MLKNEFFMPFYPRKLVLTLQNDPVAVQNGQRPALPQAKTETGPQNFANFQSELFDVGHVDISSVYVTPKSGYPPRFVYESRW